MDPIKAQKVQEYRLLNVYAKPGQTVLAGSSLCEFFPVHELLMDLGLQKTVYNRGVAGFVIEELMEAIAPCILDLRPGKLFLNIGTNNLSQPDYDQADLLDKYLRIIRRTREVSPQVRVFVLSYYPMNTLDDFGLPPEQKQEMYAHRTNEKVQAANLALGKLARENGCTYVDVNRGLTDGRGQLRAEYTIEGMHLWPNAYAQVLQNLLPHL